MNATLAPTQSPTASVANIAVLIPAWQPDQRLTGLVRQLLELNFGAIIVVNDGNGRAHDQIFSSFALEPRVHVIRHDKNLGKGRGLKTGLHHFLVNFAHLDGIVTADADGQHSPTDILRTATRLLEHRSCLILGSRSFNKAAPFRNRLGNLATRYIFAMLTGRKLTDTQSGLRAIPKPLIPSFLSLEGERYEYEMNVLIHAAGSSGVVEVPIETIYLDDNRSSHFNPLVDSMRIYFLLLRFAARTK